MNPDFSGAFGTKTPGKSTLLTYCFHSPIATRESVNKTFLRYFRGAVYLVLSFLRKGLFLILRSQRHKQTLFAYEKSNKVLKNSAVMTPVALVIEGDNYCSSPVLVLNLCWTFQDLSTVQFYSF
jgi:hypothetical protein